MLGSTKGVASLGRSDDVDLARAELDHEERVDRDETAGRPDLCSEEVSSRDAVPVNAEEVLPARASRTFWSWLDAVVLEDALHGVVANAVPEVEESALDAAVAPGESLDGHADDEVFDHLHRPRSSATRIVGPILCDQFSMPAHQGVGGYDGREFVEERSPEVLGLRSQPTPLVI